jgi:hypothetical protein
MLPERRFRLKRGFRGHGLNISTPIKPSEYNLTFL